MARWWRIFVRAGGLWLEHNAFVHAGSLAFYTLFSLAPTVIIAVSVAGILFGEEAARGEVVVQLQGLVGRDAARAVEDAVSRSRPEVAGSCRLSLAPSPWWPAQRRCSPRCSSR